MQFGYIIAKNSCQTADMVRIGFLSRVRGFTLRNDCQDFITSSPEWRETPFQFRFYFDAMGTKGCTAHILMIEVDRPNIEFGLQFFQRWFNGMASNSPNNIAYMFWPLYKKTYSDTDRLKIIVDHHHYIGTDSVVAMKGLHPLETVVCLINGVHTTIRRLLLSMPAQGTATGKLFLQVERQLTNEWLLCCFYTQDSEKVTARLSTLEDSLKKVVHPEYISKLFLSEEGLTFNGQVAPLVKGRSRIPRLDVPAPTENYVNLSMQRIYSPAAKRQATEIEYNHTTVMEEEQPTTISVPRIVPTTYASAASVVTPSPTNAGAPIDLVIQEQPTNSALHDLQTTTNHHSATLLDLKQCCANLVQSQQTLSQQLKEMNVGINSRFEIMAASIESLKLSPDRRCQKIHKDFHRQVPEETMPLH